MYSLCEISFEEIYNVWQIELWPGRDHINKLSTLTLSRDNKLDQQTYIKRYESTVVFFGLKYTNNYYEEKEELVGVNSGAQCGLRLYRSRGLWINSKHRGLGGAKDLLNVVIEEGKNRGCNRIWSLPRKNSLYAYEKAGFKKQSDWIEDDVDFGPNCIVTRPIDL
jgi:GNAT superfamily N-acetyltransferase